MAEIIIESGCHSSREEGMCAMEYAAYLAGEPHSDEPKCVDPVLRDSTIEVNDSIHDSVARTEILLPLVKASIGTAGKGLDFLAAGNKFNATREKAWECQMQTEGHHAHNHIREITAAVQDYLTGKVYDIKADIVSRVRQTAANSVFNAINIGEFITGDNTHLKQTITLIMQETDKQINEIEMAHSDIVAKFMAAVDNLADEEDKKWIEVTRGAATEYGKIIDAAAREFVAECLDIINKGSPNV